MSLAPPTPVSLIFRLRNVEDASAWSDFVDLYTPLMVAYCQHRGLQDADAADMVRDVLIKISQSVRSFEQRATGTFSGWLLTILRNRIRERARNSPPDQGSGRTTIVRMLHDQAEDSDDAERWNQAHRQRMLNWGGQKVSHEFQPATWQAFELTALRNVSASQAAQQLGISVGAVYIARSRVVKRIRQYLQCLDPGD